MLKQQICEPTGTVKVTFVLPAETFVEPVSVLGPFNGWDPLVHPLKRRSNGTRSVTVEVSAGTAYEFKYLAENGQWFCDPEAEAIEVAELHVHNSLLLT